jgi:acyl dehydratase
MPDGDARTLPALSGSYVRALLRPKHPAAASTRLPALTARTVGWRPDPLRLAAYRSVVGSAADLPIAFPQVPATALALELLTSAAFPVRAMGLVHRASVIEVLERLDPEQAWDLEVASSTGRHVRSGLEFDVRARLTIDGRLCWSSQEIYLSRSRAASGAEPSSTPELAVDGDWTAEVVMPAEERLSRDYARVSGDINPIHLHRLAARAFGFPRAIAHGAWIGARVAALLGADEALPGRRYALAFRKPVLLPSAPLVQSRRTGGATTEFVVVPGADGAGSGQTAILVAGRLEG